MNGLPICYERLRDVPRAVWSAYSKGPDGRWWHHLHRPPAPKRKLAARPRPR